MLGKYWKIWVPFLFIITIAPFSEQIDLYFSSLFYIRSHSGGSFISNQTLRFFFIYGELFGFFVGFLSLSVYLSSFILKKWTPFRRPALFMCLTLVIGAGLVTNLMFKQFWGRPRPSQIEEFGGKHAYRPFWSPNINIHTRHAFRSFPSGHTAMGFYHIAFIFIGMRYKRRVLIAIGSLLTLFWGCGLMVTRVVQGGHFATDVLIAPIIMWWVTLYLDHMILKKDSLAEFESLSIQSKSVSQM